MRKPVNKIQVKMCNKSFHSNWVHSGIKLFVDIYKDSNYTVQCLVFHSYLKKYKFDMRAMCWKVYHVCRAGLEEELDMLRVQAAMDRATVKELHLCLAKEHQGNPFVFP